MKLVTRMLHKEILLSVGMTTLAFLSLLMFFDLINESRFLTNSQSMGHGIYQMALYLALSAPMHVYDLAPICVLIGSIFVMVRYANTSQFTILRTAGLGPGRALRILVGIGLVFTCATFVLGDYIAPWAERSAQYLQANARGGAIPAGGAGAWMRERQDNGEVVIVSVAALHTDGELQGVRIFEFGSNGRLARQLHASHATVLPGAWELYGVKEEQLPDPDQASASVQIERGEPETSPPVINVSQYSTLLWPTSISSEMVSAAIMRPDGMSTVELVDYVSHLRANDQSSERFELELWRRVFYPLGCTVMMVLALPFAYLHFRSGGTVGHMFVGILVGVSYLLLNNMLGYMGMLRNWSPFLSAAAPALIYSTLAIALFVRMVRRQ